MREQKNAVGCFHMAKAKQHPALDNILIQIEIHEESKCTNFIMHIHSLIEMSLLGDVYILHFIFRRWNSTVHKQEDI